MDSFIKPRAVVALDLDYFYAQCEEARKPEIKGNPVVICVFSGRSEISGAVSTCNYEARKLGVRSGMPIAFAKRILKNIGTALFLPIDLEYYQTVSERIMEILRSKAEKFEQASIDEAFLDVSSRYDPIYEKVTKIARSIKQEILSEEKLTCSVGIGSNKLLAKMAADSKKPDGLSVILPGGEQAFLYPLPVGKLLGVGPKTEEKLKSIRVEYVADLARADNYKLSALFGKNLGPSLKEWANGIDESPVVEKPIEQMSRIITLKKDASAFDFQDVLRPISEDLARKLRLNSLQSKAIGIIAINDELKTKSRAKTLSLPTDSEKIIFNVACELFSSFFGEGKSTPSPILRRVGIKVSELSPANPESGTLENYI